MSAVHQHRVAPRRELRFTLSYPIGPSLGAKTLPPVTLPQLGRSVLSLLKSKRPSKDSPDLSETTFVERWSKMRRTCHPLNVFASEEALQRAEAIALGHILGLDGGEVAAARDLYQSAHHGETGERIPVPARLAFQAWGNMSILCCSLTFYKSAPALIAIQFANQSFNAAVNYSNRNAASSLSVNERMAAFASATMGATFTVLLLRKAIASRPFLMSGIWGRFVPFCASASAATLNVPIMRSAELRDGVTVYDERGDEIGLSRKAAALGVSETVASRILLNFPAAIGTPLLIQALEKQNFCNIAHSLARRTALTAAVGGCLYALSTPAACAFFSPVQKVPLSRLEPELQAGNQEGTKTAFFRKGM